jgi:nitrogen fixation/metabolism regulation signal transduction histidine kinase
VKLLRMRRRRYIVDKSLQYRFLATILIYGFIVVAFLSVYLFLPEIMTLQNESLSFEIRAAAADKLLTFHARIWPAAIAIIIFLGLHSIIFFHRLVGPLYRFFWAFDKVRNGDLSFRVKIRRKDYLHREESAFNEMLDALAGKLEYIHLANLTALKSLDELEQKISDQTKSDKEFFHAHRQHLDTLMDAIRYFRLETSKA